MLTGAADPTVLVYKVHPSAGLTPIIEKGYQKLTGVANNFFLIWHPSEPDKLASLDEQGIRYLYMHMFSEFGVLLSMFATMLL